MNPVSGTSGGSPGDASSGHPGVASADDASGAAGDSPRNHAARLIAGRYRLAGQIGRGAMGIVWRGRDELLARDVAVKEIEVTAHAYADVVYARTLREARTAARLSHPSVVTVYDVVEQDRSLWIVMELVRARSLDRVVIEDGPLPPLQAAELGVCLVGALSSAHSSGVLHRDVKPSNVLVTGDGKAVLTDFGIATFAEDPGVTQAGMVVGTPGFTAPERVRGEPATPASDLWSLGATMYAAVEGRGPFERAGGSTIISAGVAAEDAPRSPSAGPLGPVIDALLSRDPAARPDALTAARMFADAATAARTGAGPLGVGWLATEAEIESADGAPGEQPGLQSDATGPMTADDGAADDGGLAAASAASEQRTAFLDPPVYTALAMPSLTGQDDAGPAGKPGMVRGEGAEPVVWPPAGPPAAGPPPAGPPPASPTPASTVGSGGPAAAASTGPSTGPSTGGRHGSGQRPAAGNGMLSSGRWRLLVAAAGIAAIAIAAVIGWGIYNGIPGIHQAQHPLSSGGVAAAAHGSPSPATGSSGTAGGHKPGGTPSPGKSSSPASSKRHAHGTPTTSPSGKASSHPSPSPSGGGSPSPSGSPSPTSSPSPTPSPSPSRGSSLPNGWQWHVLSAAKLGTTAGLKIALPDAWTQSVDGDVVHFDQSARNFHLVVSLASWKYAKPLPEAQHLQALAEDSHYKYRLLVLQGIAFGSVGYTSAPAAELKFTWTRKATGVKCTELVIVVTLSTAAGDQPYSFTLWSPSASFSAASGVFHAALQTFRPES
jgi:eukaryotic-like serine/threonine-protein kinase